MILRAELYTFPLFSLSALRQPFVEEMKEGTDGVHVTICVPVHYQTVVMATVRDITEEHESHLRMTEANDHLEALGRAKSSFLANTSHEIRTPLNAIIAGSELMSEISGMTEEHRELNSMVVRSAHNLLSLVSDVLDFSKIEAERLELESRPFVLASCIDLSFEMQSLKVRC